MKDFLLFILVFFVLALAWGQQQFAYIGDFSLENGKTIDHCKIGYQVFGKLNEERSNAIVWPTWYGGSSTAISGLVGPGKFVDTNRYCLIAIDALGNGISSSPSHLKKS